MSTFFQPLPTVPPEEPEKCALDIAHLANREDVQVKVDAATG